MVLYSIIDAVRQRTYYKDELDKLKMAIFYIFFLYFFIFFYIFSLFPNKI